MVTCTECPQKAVFTSPTYCKVHFFSYIETKVKDTIMRFNLFKPNERIAVAVSGGKDSQTVLSILHRLYGNNVQAIAIDEGIPGYRDHTLDDLRHFCEPRGITYKTYSFETAFGKQLETFLKQGASPCRSCGMLRRQMLNAHAQEFDKLATGHNMDDECQNILMNLLKGNLFLLAKLGPASGIAVRQGFTPRVKPLYFISERETTAYAFLQEFPVRFRECPHAHDTFRSTIRDALNKLEYASPGTKHNIIQNFLEILPTLKEKYKDVSAPVSCRNCGGPSTGSLCRACGVVAAYV